MKNTAGQLVNLARKYEHVLSTGDASELLTLSPKNRQHAIRALSNLAKYYGVYSRWWQIKDRHQLKWSTGTDEFNARWIEDMISSEGELVERYYSNPEDHFHRADDHSINSGASDTAGDNSCKGDDKPEGGRHASGAGSSATCNHALTGTVPQSVDAEEQVTRTLGAQESHTQNPCEEGITKNESKVSTKTFAGAKTNIRIGAMDLEWRGQGQRGQEKRQTTVCKPRL